MQQCWFRTLVCRESLTLELWIKFWHARFLSGTHGVILQGADTWFVHNYRFLDSAMSPRIRSVNICDIRGRFKQVLRLRCASLRMTNFTYTYGYGTSGCDRRTTSLCRG